ncbi:glycosyltransferase family 2 protein [Trueperella sp. LYQ143]|uniref:glycosyltransferase family 2 protein n=1 Tax=Trueperella sp. LYQ143 TaxID=3391059 RepID=UPI0039836C0A
MQIRLVTVAFNPGPELVTMCESVPAACGSAQLSVEIVIVNNGDSNEYCDELERRGCQVINAGENLGFGRAVNLGARGCQAEWILVVNPDVVFAEDAIAAMLAASQFYPRAGVLGPKILTPEGEIYPSIRHFPRLISGTGHAVLGRVWPGNPWSKSYRSHGAVDATHAVDWLSGACLLIRRLAFEQIGGFDTDFFMFFEDTMLGEDMRRHGWESIYVHDATITHDQSVSWRDHPEPMIRAHHDSAYTYLSKVYARRAHAPLRAALRTGLNARRSLHIRAARRHQSQEDPGNNRSR